MKNILLCLSSFALVCCTSNSYNQQTGQSSTNGSDSPSTSGSIGDVESGGAKVDTKLEATVPKL